MGLLDRIRNLITGKKPLQLSAMSKFNSTDIDKTMPFITVDSLEALISDKDIFEKFMNFDSNRDFFKDLTPDFIARAVKEYVDFFTDKGRVFKPKERRRIDEIESILPKEERKVQRNYVQYKDIDKTDLYNKAVLIANNEEEFQKFLECQRTGSAYNGLPTQLLSEYMSTELFDFTRSFATNKMMERNIRFIVNKERTIREGSYRVNPSIELNPDFLKSIFDGIKPTNDPAEYALQLYNELNKRVKYNPSFFALNQDLTDKFAHDIYYRSISETTPQNNSIVCKQWSELYAYLLEKSGFEAHVCGTGKHKNVKAYYGTLEIDADATNQTTSPEDPSRLTDLTRSKLGVRPAGFRAYDFTGFKQVTRNLDTVKLNYDVESFMADQGFYEELSEIVNSIDDSRDLTSLVMGLNDSTNELGNIMKGIAFVSDMLKGSHLDNMDSIGYMNCLLHANPVIHNSPRVKNTNAFYKNLYTNDCDMVPIISINRAPDPSQARKEDFIYLEYIQDLHEIRPISREELIKKVVSGEYIQGRGKEDRVSIPGLPEITDKEFIQDARRRVSQRELYDATSRTARDIYEGGKLQEGGEGR